MGAATQSEFRFITRTDIESTATRAIDISEGLEAYIYHPPTHFTIRGRNVAPKWNYINEAVLKRLFHGTDGGEMGRQGVGGSRLKLTLFYV